MYLWNTKVLGENLVQNKISKGECVQQLFLLIALLLLPLVVLVKGIIPINLIAASLSLLILLGTLFFSYKTNQSRDGKAFGTRLICVSGPLLLKVSLMWGIVWFVIKLVMPSFIESSWFPILFWPSLLLLFSHWLQGHIFELSKLRVSWEVHQGI